MDPGKVEEECQSSSESGWTMYLGSPQDNRTYISQEDDDDIVHGVDDGYYRIKDDDDDGDDDDDSVASDASSGPSNHHPWVKEEQRTNHVIKPVVLHGEDGHRPLAEEKEKKMKKARAYSEQHVTLKKRPSTRMKKQHQGQKEASNSHANVGDI